MGTLPTTKRAVEQAKEAIMITHEYAWVRRRVTIGCILVDGSIVGGNSAEVGATIGDDETDVCGCDGDAARTGTSAAGICATVSSCAWSSVGTGVGSATGPDVCSSMGTSAHSVGEIEVGLTIDTGVGTDVTGMDECGAETVDNEGLGTDITGAKTIFE
ncbi:hypothetical protein FRX31_026152 [Thalictrum thalictroides]|uniref:Uncharacterized protein n=1 Tax=Thalictrum thalictroides TaxID=46969 RepID=A0A7J6VHP8_THATH|nr:hypothetical protein FRX31_026152 [Thalictrum thalictroides]